MAVIYDPRKRSTKKLWHEGRPVDQRIQKRRLGKKEKKKKERQYEIVSVKGKTFSS